LAGLVSDKCADLLALLLVLALVGFWVALMQVLSRLFA